MARISLRLSPPQLKSGRLAPEYEMAWFMIPHGKGLGWDVLVRGGIAANDGTNPICSISVRMNNLPFSLRRLLYFTFTFQRFSISIICPFSACVSPRTSKRLAWRSIRPSASYLVDLSVLSPFNIFCSVLHLPHRAPHLHLSSISINLYSASPLEKPRKVPGSPQPSSNHGLDGVRERERSL